ncbi:MAG: hypothetical protein JW915_23880 [Chitinispirillaceae bacterium]|nr:hypothetical protein [Chitinispirillaceae bacterium]
MIIQKLVTDLLRRSHEKKRGLNTGCNERSGHSSGGVILRIVIISATLLLIGITVVFLLKNFRNREEINGRKAMSISEYGLLQAMQKLNEQPGWRDGFNHIRFEDGWYSVTLKDEYSGDTLFLKVESNGQIGSIVDQRTVTLRRIVTGTDTIWNHF